MGVPGRLRDVYRSWRATCTTHALPPHRLPTIWPTHTPLPHCLCYHTRTTHTACISPAPRHNTSFWRYHLRTTTWPGPATTHATHTLPPRAHTAPFCHAPLALHHLQRFVPTFTHTRCLTTLLRNSALVDWRAWFYNAVIALLISFPAIAVTRLAISMLARRRMIPTALVIIITTSPRPYASTALRTLTTVVLLRYAPA